MAVGDRDYRDYMKENHQLSATDLKIWKAGSALQKERPEGAPSPNFEEIASRAGVSRTTVGNVIPHLMHHGIVKRFGSRRSVFFATLYTTDLAKKLKKAADQA